MKDKIKILTNIDSEEESLKSIEIIQDLYSMEKVSLGGRESTAWREGRLPVQPDGRLW